MAYPRTNGFAITSLVCGILGLCAGGLLAAIPAIVFGHIALAQINRLGGIEQGRGLAIAGLVMGYVYLALITLYGVFIFGLSRCQAFSPEVTAGESIDASASPPWLGIRSLVTLSHHISPYTRGIAGWRREAVSFVSG